MNKEEEDTYTGKRNIIEYGIGGAIYIRIVTKIYK